MAGPIEDHTANLVIAQLLFLASEDQKKEIQLYITSPGGPVTAGLAILDTMTYIKPDVATVCVGIAASAAAAILPPPPPSRAPLSLFPYRFRF